MKRDALLTVLILSAASTVLAQSKEPIPRDVVMAILRNRQVSGPSEPTITMEDKLPPGLDTRVALPPRSHITVTLHSGNVFQVIGTTPGDPDSVRMWFTDDFEHRGYPPTVPAGRPEHPAFRPAQRSPATFGYCGQNWHFAVSAARRSPGVVEFALHAVEAGCGQWNAYMPQGGSGWGANGFDPPPFPVLYRPRFAESADRCTIGIQTGRSFRTTEETIATTMKPSDMLAYYGRQLDSAGWKAESRLVGASGTWTKRDSTGRDLRTVLSILPGVGSSDCRKVSLWTGDSHP